MILGALRILFKLPPGFSQIVFCSCFFWAWWVLPFYLLSS